MVWVIGTPPVSTKSRYSDAVDDVDCSRVAITSKRDPRAMPKSPDSDEVLNVDLSIVSWSVMKS